MTTIYEVGSSVTGESILKPATVYPIRASELTAANGGHRNDLIVHRYKVYALDGDLTQLYQSDGSQLVPAAKQKELAAATGIYSPVFMTNDTRLLVDAFGVAVGGGGTPPAVDPYVEVLNFAALPGSPAEGDTYIALASQGIRFINYKAAGLYRYTSGVWAYLGAVPEGYFTDNVLTFYDNVDPTKQAMLELSGITTGTSRVLTVPDKNGIIATLDDIVAGSSDHGALTGLGDDDHTQYHNDARGDLRYQPLSTVLTNTTASFTTADETKLDALAVMVGATAVANGVTGTVPVALAGDEAKVLLGNGTWAVPASGVTDHGALTGLSDDDHPQYHNDARGDLRYQPLSAVLTNTTASFTTADETKLDALAVMVGATALTNGVTGTVPAALAGDEAKVLRGDGTWVVSTSGVTDHGALTGLSDDDHTQYHTDARADLRYQPLSTVLTNTTASFTTADETKLDALAVMVGATSVANGVTGTVPAALAGDQDKYLKADGTFAIPEGAQKLTATADAAYTVAAADTVVNLTLAGAQVVTLPSAATFPNRVLQIRNATATAKTFAVGYTDMHGATNTSIPARSVVCLQSNGTAWLESIGTDRAIAVQSFTASGTYTPTPGMRSCIVEISGGGAGGRPSIAAAAGQVSIGSPGGNGGYARVLLTRDQVGASVAVTIGAGGASGVAGGNTTFGALITCSGGAIGGVATSGIVRLEVGGAGGNATVTTGQTIDGQSGRRSFSQAYVIGTTHVGVRAGTPSPLGAGALPQTSSGTTAVSSTGDSAAGNGGCGGNGGYSALAGALAPGGAGSAGYCVVTEYF